MVEEALDSAETAFLQGQEDVHNAEVYERLPRSRSGPLKGRWTLPSKPLRALKRLFASGARNFQFSVVTSPVDGYVVTRDLEEGATVVLDSRSLLSPNRA